MSRLDGDGEAINKNGTRRSGTASVNRHTHADVNSVMQDARAEVSCACYATLMRFVDHQQGSLKITRSQTGEDLHLIFTWTAGPNTGRYVYYCTQYWHVAFGLEVLFQKVLEVDAGIRKSTPDRMKTRPG